MGEVPPPISSQSHPDLSRIGEYEFQDLTVALLDRESDLTLARLHGTRGTKQFGADATAFIDSGGKAAASCKRYKRGVDVDLIKAACEEFDQHWAYWKAEGVRRFIVVVSGYAGPDVQKEETAQKKRYKRKKIDFELWDGTTIVQKIRRYPPLVHQYLGSNTWISQLCGPEYLPAIWAQSGTREAESQNLRALLGETARADVESFREALRRGHRAEVGAKLARLRDNRPLWGQLPPEVRASALRLQASLLLEMDSVSEAEPLLDEAVALDGSLKAIGLRTRIQLQKFGPEKALAQLPEIDEDSEALCARGSLLLLLARQDEAETALQAASLRNPNDVDAARLLALVYAMRGDISRALEFAGKAFALAPDWEIVRRTRGVIYYLSALSSPRVQRPASAMPEPIEWPFVRRDETSAARLAEAFEIFNRMAQDTDRPIVDKQAIEIWSLACISNIESRQSEASEYCGRLISKHPSNIYAVPWAIVRGYRADFDRALKISELRMDGDTQDVRPCLVGVICRIRSTDYAGAKALLLKHENRFRNASQTEAWNRSWISILLTSGDAEAALEFIRSTECPGDLEGLEFGALIHLARKRGETDGIKADILSRYERSGDPRYLLLWAEQQGLEGQWHAIAERSEELLKSFPTPDGLFLALMADFQTREYVRCLSRTEQYRGVFGDSRWPLDIRRLRVGCLERSGNPKQALDEASRLRGDDNSTETNVAFVRLCVGYGDIPDAVAAARDLVGRDDLSADDALSLSDLLSPHDLQLARRFLRLARPANLPESRLLDALNLGQRLAITTEQNELRERLQGAITKGTFAPRTLQPDSVQQFVEQARHQAEDLLRLYEFGQVPIHALIDLIGLNVIALIGLDVNEFRPLQQFTRFTNHGSGRDGTSKITAGISRLNLDVTSTLLIHRFDLWDAAARVFPMIRCSRRIIGLINQTLASIMNGRPQADTALLEVWRAYQSGNIAVGTASADWMLTETGDAPDYIRATCAIEALRKRGHISEAERAAAVQSISPGVHECGEMFPEPGQLIRCSQVSLTLIAEAGMLERLLTVFRCTITPDCRKSLERDVLALNERTLVESSLKAAVQDIGERFRTGVLGAFPEVPPDQDAQTPAMSALSELIAGAAGPEDVICADDRFINGFELREPGSVPIVCLGDILRVLAARGVLDRTRVWQIAHSMRSHNCRFLSLEAEEIAHHLAAALVEKDAVVETPELRILRQYVGACLASGTTLQRSNPTGGQQGEAAFVVSLRRAALEALALIWQNSTLSVDGRAARATWLIESLYVDFPGLCFAVGASIPQTEEREATAMAAATLLMLNIGPREPDGTGAGVYNRWIWNSLFRRRSNADPNLHEEISKLIARYLAEAIEQSRKEDRDRLVAASLHVVSKFPESLRARVHELLEAFYRQAEGVHRVFHAASLEFDAPAFMNQASVALTVGSAEIRSLRPKQQLIMRRVSTGLDDAIDLVMADDSVHRLRNALWGVLFPDRIERNRSLRTARHLFDLSEAEFETLLVSIDSAPTPFDRFGTLAAAAKRSLPFFCDALQQRVLNREDLTRADLTPSDGGAFFQYFGSSGEAVTDAGVLIESAIEHLLVRIGPVETTVRFTTLPIPLPARVEAFFLIANPEQQHEYFRAIAKSGLSPVKCVHLIRLAHLAHTTAFTTRLRAWLIRRHLGERQREEWRAFIALLSWVADEFEDGSANGSRWSRSLRLMFSWVHATHLFAIYRRAKAPPQGLAEAFRSRGGYQAMTNLEDEFVHGRDACSPDSVNPDRLSASGLAYALPPEYRPLPADAIALARLQWYGNDGVPTAAFLEISSNAPNVLGSFLGTDHLQNLNSLLGETAGQYTPDWRAAILEHVLTSITTHTDRLDDWPFLAALYGTIPAPKEAAVRIDDALTNLDLPVAVETARENQGPFLLAFANRIAHAERPTAREAIANSILRLARWYGAHEGTSDEAALLLNLVIAHEYPAPERAATLANLEKLCVDCASEFPKFVRPCREMVERFCHDLPTDRGKKFWPLALKLRAIDQGQL